MTKDFDVKVTVRNGRLLRAINERYNSIAEFSRDIGRGVHQLHSLVGMKTSPYVRGAWTQLAFDVAAWLGKEPEDLWPEYMKDVRLKRNTSSFEANLQEIQQITSSNNPDRQVLMLSVIKQAASVLTPRELKVVQRLHVEDCTLDDVAKELNRSRSRVQHIEVKAMRKMRGEMYRAGLLKGRDFTSELTQDGHDLLNGE